MSDPRAPTYEQLSALCAQMAAALEKNERQFEFIRKTLVNNLVEPERSAFWAAVHARDETRKALTAYRTLSPDPQWQRVPTREKFVAAIKATPTRPSGYTDYGDIYDSIYNRARGEG